MLFTGSELDALAVAVQANVKHGKPLSRAERQAAARALLCACPEQSDRWLGEICGLSHTTVGVLRRSLGKCDQQVRTGRDGRRRPVNPLRGQMAIAELVAGKPNISIREAASAVGVAPSTVHRVVAGLTKQGKPSSVTKAPAAGKTAELRCALLQDPAFQASTEYANAAFWLAKTTVTVEDLTTHLASLPLSRTYEVADECRRRARAWTDIADSLETRLRRRPTT